VLPAVGMGFLVASVAMPAAVVGDPPMQDIMQFGHTAPISSLTLSRDSSARWQALPRGNSNTLWLPNALEFTAGHQRSQAPKLDVGGITKLGLISQLGGITYLAKVNRLVLFWQNDDLDMWDTEHGSRLRFVKGGSVPIAWCVASPEQNSVLTGDDIRLVSKDAQFVPSIRLWDSRTGKQKFAIDLPEARAHKYYLHSWYPVWIDESHVIIVRVVRTSPARAASHVRLLLIDTNAGKLTKASDDCEGVGERLVVAPDGKTAVMLDDNSVTRTESGDVLVHTGNTAAKTSVFSMENLTVISSWREKETVVVNAQWLGDSGSVVTIDNPDTNGKLAPRLQVRRASDGKVLRTLQGHTDYVLDLAVTKDGKKILTASEDRTLRLWDMETGNQTVLTGHSAGLNGVVLLRGDKLAVSIAEDSTAKVWDMVECKLKYDLSDHDSAVRKVEVLSDKQIRTTTRNGTSTIWDCSTGTKLNVVAKGARYGCCELIENNKQLVIETKR
jgi:WD40 repeat protein